MLDACPIFILTNAGSTKAEIKVSPIFQTGLKTFGVGHFCLDQSYLVFQSSVTTNLLYIYEL